MSDSLSDKIAAALENEVRWRRDWDEAPGVYLMYAESGGCRISQIPIPDMAWAGVRPALVLHMLADGIADNQSLIRPVAPSDLFGAAFRSEAWMISVPQDSAEASQAIEDQKAGRIHDRSDRVEVRQMWAVDRMGNTYMCSLERVSGQLLQNIWPADSSRDLGGDIPDALDRMVTGMLAVTLPERRERP